MDKVHKVHIEQAGINDTEEIYKLQKLAYLSEAEIYNDFSIPPLIQTFDEFLVEFRQQVYLKAEVNGELVGSVRGFAKDGTCYVGRLIVNPEQQNQGIGTSLIKAIEQHFLGMLRFEIFTGIRSERNIYLYQKMGYRIFETRRLTELVELHFLEKVCS